MNLLLERDALHESERATICTVACACASFSTRLALLLPPPFSSWVFPFLSARPHDVGMSNTAIVVCLHTNGEGGRRRYGRARPQEQLRIASPRGATRARRSSERVNKRQGGRRTTETRKGERGPSDAQCASAGPRSDSNVAREMRRKMQQREKRNRDALRVMRAEYGINMNIA
jgi:hypothetical protein